MQKCLSIICKDNVFLYLGNRGYMFSDFTYSPWNQLGSCYKFDRKAVIDVFHELFVEKRWHGFRTSIRSLGNKIIFILLSISSMYRISTCCIHTCTWYKNTINSTCIKKTLSKKYNKLPIWAAYLVG